MQEVKLNPSTAAVRKMRQLLLDALNEKTSWGRNELRRLVDDSFLRALDEVPSLVVDSE